MRSMKFFHRKQEKESWRYTRREIVKNILAVIGGLVLLNFFITEILHAAACPADKSGGRYIMRSAGRFVIGINGTVLAFDFTIVLLPYGFQAANKLFPAIRN